MKHIQIFISFTFHVCTFGGCVYECVCLHICGYMCGYIPMWVTVHGCGGLRLMLGIILDHSSSLGAEAGSLTQTQSLLKSSVLSLGARPHPSESGITGILPMILVGSGHLNCSPHICTMSTQTQSRFRSPDLPNYKITGNNKR